MQNERVMQIFITYHLLDLVVVHISHLSSLHICFYFDSNHSSKPTVRPHFLHVIGRDWLILVGRPPEF